ncbi:MAG: glycosyltransferase family 39 protein [Chloroflexi bacterium]|nr:glycosyltransferase family 39 protein [Chloroflexota bacterium]
MARRRTRRSANAAPELRREDIPPVEAVPVPEPIPALERAPEEASGLTVEHVLWAVVIAVAAFVRINDLAWTSLSDAEAALANAGLDLLRGGATAALGARPLFSALAGLAMAIFGASDASARIVSALAGIIPVALTYWLRPLLGRIGAIAAALVFTVSATFLTQSRTANGDMLAFAGIYAALVGITLWLQTRAPSRLYLAAAGVAIALVSSPIAYTALLIVGVFAALALVLRARRLVDVSNWERAFYMFRGMPGASRKVLAVFALVFAGGATAGLVNPGGLQAAANLAADWLGAWGGTPARPASFAFDVLVRYELLPLTFGLAGLFYMLARGDRLALFMAWWLSAALTFTTLSPERTPAVILLVLLPLVWVTGRVVDDLAHALGRSFSAANEGTFIMLGLITLGIIYINLAAYANDGTSSHLVVAAIGAAMLVLIALMTLFLAAYYEPASGTAGGHSGSALMLRVAPVWRDGFDRAYVIAGLLALVALASMQARAGLLLAFTQSDNPRELLVSSPATIDARTIAPVLAGLSNRWDGDPTTAPIVASAGIGPALRWYLRDFRTVRFVDGIIATADEPIVIVPATDTQPGFGVPYAAQKMRWRWLASDLPSGTGAYLRWMLFNGIRTVPPSYDIIVYVQQK